MSIDIQRIRKDFPILSQTINKNPLVYLDNGATTQKPIQVIDVISETYKTMNSNIHRGVHTLSDRTTEAYEASRERIRKFINAEKSSEIIFTRGTTESINLIAFSFGERYVEEGDEILISAMEHHSNIVPWQMMCLRKKAILKVIGFDQTGELEIVKLKSLITKKTKLIALTHISNTLGTVNPVKEIIEIAHKKNVPVLIDGAQAVQHKKVDVQDLNCDFYVFSGHKMYASTGIGVLYAKTNFLEEMPPYQGGGEMISEVTFEKTIYNVPPFKFEAGTPDFVGAISLAKAIEYIESIGIENIANYEESLLNYATEQLLKVNGLKIYGNAKNKASLISFLIEGIHHFDTGQILDQLGIAVRTGNHCAQPVMAYYGITGTVRASFAFYNTIEEIDLLVKGLYRVKKMFE